MKVDPVAVEETDIGELTSLWNEAAAPESSMYRRMSCEEVADRIAGRAGVPADLLVVARDRGGIAGAALGCSVGLVEKGEATLAVLAVAPSHRGCSVGRELLRAFEEEAVKRGCGRIAVSPAANVRFAFGVDPGTFGYRYLWERGFVVFQTHLYMQKELVGEQAPPAVRVAIKELEKERIRIRPAVPDDARALATCARELRDRMVGAFERNAASESPLPVLVASRGDEVLGFVGPLSVSPSGVPDFDFIAVSRRARGKGIGTALFTLALEHFARSGARVMELMTDPDNPAQKVYFRAGFGSQRVFACMVKDLTTPAHSADGTR